MSWGTNRYQRLLTLVGVSLVAAGLIPAAARGESKHIFGIHFWDWGANVDVLSHRTGWVVEASTTSGGSGPNVSGRYSPATAQGFTIIQRLDWKWEQTVPLTGPEQDQFAQQCATNWALPLRKYCRHYSIGNEVEFFNVTPSIYASAFTKVRNAIKIVQPEARVIIGHMNNINNQRAVMQILGPDGYDGVTAHTGSSVPTGLLDILDAENARPGVGVYITEWGWVRDTNPNAMNVIRGFYLDLGASNASRERQVYCACWFVYPNNIGWDTFSLELAQIDNPAFEAATAIGTSVNSYAANPVVMTELAAELADTGRSIVLSWNTNVPARRQAWWTPAGTSGAGFEAFVDLDDSLSGSHRITISGLQPSTAYEVMPTSTRDDYADAGGRRFRVKTGPWASQVGMTGAGSILVSWATDWAADSRVEYGPTPGLGQSVEVPALVTQHEVPIGGLPFGVLHYRIASSEPNPDGNAPLAMRSPIRTFKVKSPIPGDFNQDGDVDAEDFGRFQACLSGANIVQDAAECFLAKLDADEDVDPFDTDIFLACLSGPGIPAEPGCGP